MSIRVKACLFEKDRNFLNISLSIGKKTEKKDISYTAKSTCDSSIRLQSYSKAFSTALLFSKYLLSFTYLHTIIWKLKRKIRLILWADQLNTFFVSLKSYISSFFPLLVLSVLPSQQVFDDESYLRRQNCNFLFLSSVCTGGRKAISKLMFPNSGCQFQWKTNLFL